MLIARAESASAWWGGPWGLLLLIILAAASVVVAYHLRQRIGGYTILLAWGGLWLLYMLLSA